MSDVNSVLKCKIWCYREKLDRVTFVVNSVLQADNYFYTIHEKFKYFEKHILLTKCLPAVNYSLNILCNTCYEYSVYKILSAVYFMSTLSISC